MPVRLFEILEKKGRGKAAVNKKFTRNVLLEIVLIIFSSIDLNWSDQAREMNGQSDEKTRQAIYNQSAVPIYWVSSMNIYEQLD